jgi:hypothetical protein
MFNLRYGSPQKVDGRIVFRATSHQLQGLSLALFTDARRA